MAPQLRAEPGGWLRLAGWGSGAPPLCRVQAGGVAVDLPFRGFVGSEGPAALLRLPAFLFTRLPETPNDGPGGLVCTVAGLSCRITRADLRAGLELLARAEDPADLLRALELAAAADLFAELSPAAQARLVDLAEREQLAALLPDLPDLAEAAAPLAEPAALDRLRDGYAAARAADPARDPGDVLAEVLGAEVPPAGLVLTLAEDFCRAGRMAALAALVQARGVGLPAPTPGDGWTNSALLPFLILSGDLAGAQVALDHLAADRQGWLVTPALAFVVDHLLARPLRPEALPPETPALLRGVLAVIAAQAQDGWGRALCRVLIATSLRLLAADLPADLAADVAGAVLRSHGLSPAFWAGAAALDLPPALRQAQGDFALVSALVRDGSQTAGQTDAARAALARLAAAGVQGVAAFRAECPALALPDDPEALLRRHAAPAAPDVAPDRLEALRAAVAARLEPALPEGAAALRAGFALARRLQQAGAEPAQAQAQAAELAALLPALGWRQGGLALGLATLPGLIRARRRAALAPLCRVLDQMTVAEAPMPDALPWLLARIHQALEDRPQIAADLAVLLARLASRSVPGALAPLPAGASPLTDTLVMIRARRGQGVQLPGWLAGLAPFGIPHLCAEMDGPETQVAQMLALLDRAADQGFAHVWIIEADSQLDPQAVFGAFSWRLADYYGRWQQPKPGFRDKGMVGGMAGAGALDLAPVAGGHADAGLGYALSRRALLAIRAQLQTEAGARLALQATEPDRLVGALLARAGIGPLAPDHSGALLRPARPGGLPVPGAVPGFLPSAASGARAGHGAPPAPPMALRPAKLWPATIPARIGPSGRALTLVAGADRLAQATSAPVAVICVLRNEMFFLPQFLAHYRRLGVTAFLIGDNGSDDGSAEYLAAQPDVVLFSAPTPFREAMQGTEWKIALMAQLRPGGWSLIADADELLVARGLRGPGHPQGWQGGLSLPDFLAQPQFAGCDAFRLMMLDMYPEGPLSQATFAGGDPFAEAGLADRAPFRPQWLGHGPYSDRRAVTSALRHRLLPGARPDMFVAEKVALFRYRPWMRLSVSLHYAAEVQLAPQELIFAHFKYTAEFRAKARREIRRGQYYDNAAEYRRYMALLSEGRAVIADPAVSVPWRQAVAGWL